MNKRKCERCNKWATKDSRFCFFCKADVRHEMVSSKYLTDRPKPQYRPPGSHERTDQTKHGID